MNKYMSIREYIGRGGAFVQLSPSDGAIPKWFWTTPDHRGRPFGPFKNKIRALIDMSHRCGRSAEDMQWIPVS